MNTSKQTRSNFPVLIVSLVVVLLLALVMLFVDSHQRREISRLGANLEAAHSRLSTLTLRNDQLAAEAYEQTLTTQELRHVNQSLAQELELMDIKLRNAQSATRTTQQTVYHVRMDTVYRPLAADTLRLAPTLHYTDPWLTATLVADSLHITARDTITLVRTSRARRFLFWTWRRYDKHVRIYNHNPHVQTTTLESVEFE